jgi:hypothetical protein
MLQAGSGIARTLGWTLAVEPPDFVFWLALALAVLAVGGFAARGASAGTLRPGRFASGLALAALIAALLALALRNPSLTRLSSGEGFHLVALLDVSESQDRAEGGREGGQRRLAQLIGELAKRPGAGRATGSFVTFAASSQTVVKDQPLAKLARTIASSTQTVASDGTRVELGLEEALKLIGGRPGAVMLASDGLEVGGSREAALEAASRLAGRGVAVHAIERESAPPALAMFSVNAPRIVKAGEKASLRLFAGAGRAGALGSRGAAAGSVSVSIDGGAGRRMAVGGTGKRQLSMRAPLAFDAVGVHYATVRLDGGDGRAQRRVFSLAARKPRLLAIGPAQWIGALRSNAFEIRRAAPEDDFDPAQYDVVVLDAVNPGALRGGALNRIASAVRNSGLGLFIVNGPHRGPDGQPPLLRAYEDTAAAALLPLRSKKDAEKDERAVRLYLMIDESGSMGDPAGAGTKESRIDVGHFLTHKIIERLGGGDKLAILNFDGTILLGLQSMTPAGKRAAHESLRRSGGSASCPEQALRRLEKMDVKRPCSLVLLTDTETPCEARYQGCSTQTFGVNYDRAGERCPPNYLALGGCEFYAGGVVRLTELDGGEKDLYVVRGEYAPEPSRGFERFAAPLLNLRDSVIAQERPDAALALTRRGVRVDPVLAYLRSGAGVTGVLATAVAPRWASDPDGAAALNAWIEQVLAWRDRDRYDIAVTDYGRWLKLRIGLNADKMGRAPPETAIEAHLETSSGEKKPLHLRRDSSGSGRFTGRIQLGGEPDAGAVLVIREKETGSGRDREQRIPFRAPAASDGVSAGFGSEKLSHGLDRSLLEEIRSITGGRIASASAISLESDVTQPKIALWPGLLTLAAALFAALAALSRLGEPKAGSGRAVRKRGGKP